MPHLLRSSLWLAFFGLILVSRWIMVKMSTSMGLSVLGRPDAMGETLRRIALRFGAKMPVVEICPLDWREAT
ncbi:hypothetical protein [Sulfitobacter sp.]|uniref:hypothetical protein n=1 Tax=Sulfitobacter sp. TaxID=1903071 RepID=UPI003EF29378